MDPTNMNSPPDLPWKARMKTNKSERQQGPGDKDDQSPYRGKLRGIAGISPHKFWFLHDITQACSTIGLDGELGF
jgi:hypothetical protein